MKIEKVTEVFFRSTDGKVINDGDKVVFEDNNGKCCCGIWRGFATRGAVRIDSLIREDSPTIIMPNSIKRIFVATIDILED